MSVNTSLLDAVNTCLCDKILAVSTRQARIQGTTVVDRPCETELGVGLRANRGSWAPDGAVPPLRELLGIVVCSLRLRRPYHFLLVNLCSAFRSVRVQPHFLRLKRRSQYSWWVCMVCTLMYGLQKPLLWSDPRENLFREATHRYTSCTSGLRLRS